MSTPLGYDPRTCIYMLIRTQSHRSRSWKYILQNTPCQEKKASLVGRLRLYYQFANVEPSSVRVDEFAKPGRSSG